MDDLHPMSGFPMSKDNRIPRNLWDRTPWNRWSFQHIREILPTTEVWRGTGASSVSYTHLTLPTKRIV